MKSNLKVLIALLLCISSMITLFACVDTSEKNPGGTQDSFPEQTTAPEQTTDPEKATEAITTAPVKGETMKIEAGYTVTSEITFTTIGIEKKETLTLTARVATLVNEAGEHALYLDILNTYGAILDFKIWKGRCQLHVNNEGELFIFRINVKNDLTTGSAESSVYNITDTKVELSGEMFTSDHAKIIKVETSYDASVNFSLQNSAQIAVSKNNIKNFFDKYDHLLTIASQEETEEEKGKGYVYLIADTYSDAGKDMTYHPDSKTPRPNLEIKEVKEKYTVDYIVDLFKK